MRTAWIFVGFWLGGALVATYLANWGLVAGLAFALAGTLWAERYKKED